jgi:hypothetical protein
MTWLDVKVLLALITFSVCFTLLWSLAVGLIRLP